MTHPNVKKVSFGIMCGRLSPALDPSIVQIFPVHNWQQEFLVYERLGINRIEWVLDATTVEHNPLFQDREEIKKLCDKHGITVSSLMAHLFIEKHMFEGDQAATLILMEKIFEACQDLQVKLVEFPFFENSSLSKFFDQDQLVDFIKDKVVPLAEKYKVMISLETDLSPQVFAQLLQRIDHPLVKVTLDTGNSAALDYDVGEEINLLKEWLVNVHIKDKDAENQSVPLGQGKVDFSRFFQELEKNSYQGEFILETYMGKPDADVPEREQRIRKYLDFLEQRRN